MRELSIACDPARQPFYHIDPSWRHNRYQPPPPQEVLAISQRCIDVFFLSPGDIGLGGIGGIGWWQAANAYSAIALRDLWSGSRHNYGKLDSIFRQCESRHRGFINEFNDDTLWWAMCCLHMYSIAGDEWYLQKARAVWKHIRNCGSVCRRGQMRFRDMDMEGGCYWTTRPDEEQINAISSGLFAELSVRLALIDSSVRSKGQLYGDGDGGNYEQRHSGSVGLLSQLKNATFGGFIKAAQSSSAQGAAVASADYLEAARRSLGWILRCRYRNEDAIVLDGFLTRKNVCNDWTFTYTTGVAIGICALMYQAIPDEEDYLYLACHMANKAMRRQGWVDQATGVVSAEGEFGKGKHDPFENNDSIGFKSVLVRQLCTLYDVIRTFRAGAKATFAKETADLIETCMKLNFESQVHRNTNGIGQYGPWWLGPFESPTSHSQMAMLDVMAAIELVTRK